MVRGLGFVVLLYAMGAICLFIGVGELFETGKFWLHGARGYMESSDPGLPKALKNGLYIPRADVTYVTPAGRIDVPQKGLTAGQANRLIAGQQIRVYFLKNNPDFAYFDGEGPDPPWGWLIVGMGLLFGASYGRRLYVRERDG